MLIQRVDSRDRVAAPREVEAKATPVSRLQIRDALSTAYRGVVGRAPNAPTLDVLEAHVAHETARGSKMFNFNFGGIKGTGPSGTTARYRTREVTPEGEKRIVDSFRAYAGVVEGAVDYMRLLKSHYSTALEKAEGGDVDGFAASLKKGCYYTASLDDYAASLRALVHDKRDVKPASVPVAPPPADVSSAALADRINVEQLLTRAELERIVSAISILGRSDSAEADGSTDWLG